MKFTIMPSSFLLALLLGSIPALQAAAAAPTGPDVRSLAVVGGDTLTTEDLDSEISATLAEAKGRELPELDPDQVLKRLVQNRLLEQEGYRIGADQAPIVRNQVRDFIRIKSVRALLDSLSAPRAGTVPESPDSILGGAGLLKRYSHVLVKDEALAAALRDSLAKGAPFADLARRHSIDGTAARGGDLDWAAEGAYVDAFEAAASRLSQDEISGPVQTQFGWHLITLTGVRADTLKSKAMAEALVAEREKARRGAAVEGYVDSLKAAYGVTVDDSLLASLDYQSEDPEVQKKLKASEAVLAVLPTGRLTVRGLTRNIGFQYFHGLGGRSEAPQVRDRMFREWVTEGLLSHEARNLGFDSDPGLLAKASKEERRLIREEVLKNVVGFEFKPSDEEIREYYEAHQNDFTPPPRVKVQSVLARNVETARRFREEMDAGAGLKWLVNRSPGEVDSLPPYPGDWIEAEVLGLKDQPLVEGSAIGPMELRGGWAVAQIVGVERTGPAALADCREKVIREMKGARIRQAIGDAFTQLESATEIRLLPGAKEAVADRIQRFRTSRPEGESQ